MAFTANVSAVAALVDKTQEEVVAVEKHKQDPSSLTVDELIAFVNIPETEVAQIEALLESKSIIPPDKFSEILTKQIRDGNKDQAAIVGKRNQAYRGFTPKEEQIASLRIIANQDLVSGQVDQSKLKAGGIVIYGTDQFILQSATEPDDEKVQIVETFGQPVAFFYGRRPRMYTYSGTLLNGADTFSTGDNSANNIPQSTVDGEATSAYSTLWRDNFKLGYELFLRGTRSVRFRARAYLTYDRVIREGFIVRSSISQDIRPNMVSFMFSMFVTREINLDGVQALESNTLDGKSAPGITNDALILRETKVSIGFNIQQVLGEAGL